MGFLSLVYFDSDDEGEKNNDEDGDDGDDDAYDDDDGAYDDVDDDDDDDLAVRPLLLLCPADVHNYGTCPQVFYTTIRMWNV